jgi:hypothetical protein
MVAPSVAKMPLLPSLPAVRAAVGDVGRGAVAHREQDGVDAVEVAVVAVGRRRRIWSSVPFVTVSVPPFSARAAFWSAAEAAVVCPSEVTASPSAVSAPDSAPV